MTTTKMKPGTFKHIEAEISAFPDMQKEIQKRREELLHPTMTEELVGGKSNLPSDPTGAMATRLSADKRLQELERIESAIQSVYDKLEDKPRELVRMVYWTRHRKTWEGMAMELEVGRTTLFRWRNEIVKAVGDKLGWH